VRRDRFAAKLDHGGGADLAGFNPARQVEGREHQNFLSRNAVSWAVSRRTGGMTMNAVMAATGQPRRKADSQRFTKSARNPILAQVTTALTTKTTIAAMRMGKMNRALSPIHAPPCMGDVPGNIPGIKKVRKR
jgi:hypothetical protein